MGGKSLKDWELMKIWGIPLRIHPSWLAIVFFFTWAAQGQISKTAEAGTPLWMIWGLGLLTSLLLFISVLFHELGHSFVALREGVKVRSITMFFLGGVARIERECPTPMGCLRVAIAGPLVSFFLSIFFVELGKNFSSTYPLLSAQFSLLGSLNFVLALFNLLPGLPLDGGIILKSLVWHFTGSYRKGLKVANSSGRFLSFLAIFIGIWSCLKGAGLGGVWLIMIGSLGLSSSRSQSQILILQKALMDVKVRDAKGKSFRVIEEDQNLKKLGELKVSTSKDKLSDWILVCNSGRWVGYITKEILNDNPVQNWEKFLVSDLKKPLKELPSINEKSPLWEAVIQIEKSAEGKLLVFNIAGLPSGTLDRVDLGDAILKKLGIKLPKNFIDTARSQNTYPLGIDFPDIVKSMITSKTIVEVRN